MSENSAPRAASQLPPDRLPASDFHPDRAPASCCALLPTQRGTLRPESPRGISSNLSLPTPANENPPGFLSSTVPILRQTPGGYAPPAPRPPRASPHTSPCTR